MIREPWKLVVALIASHAAGVLGSLFTISSIGTWYTVLSKPAWTPPSWLFAPVWLSLYTLMGVAAWLVWISKSNNQRALGLFVVQLGLNAAWSIVFFGLQRVGAALVVILILFGMIAWTAWTFYEIKKEAAYLLVPYLLWVGFASVLNYSIWVLN